MEMLRALRDKELHGHDSAMRFDFYASFNCVFMQELAKLKTSFDLAELGRAQMHLINANFHEFESSFGPKLIILLPAAADGHRPSD